MKNEKGTILKELGSKIAEIAEKNVDINPQVYSPWWYGGEI